jgi:hypothetical protein
MPKFTPLQEARYTRAMGGHLVGCPVGEGKQECACDALEEALKAAEEQG